MREFCIGCQEELEDQNWKNRGEGWICSRHFAHRKPVNLTDIRNYEQSKAPDFIQPYRGEELSKEFVDTYGPETAKRWGASDKQIRNAKDTWKDL